MKVDLFDFHLPKEMIAMRPAVPRDSARLLHVTDKGLADWRVSDLPKLLQSGDFLVCNDTKVIPTRLSGRRGAASVEVTLHTSVGANCWWAFARPARKLSLGEHIDFSEDFSASVLEKGGDGQVLLCFSPRKETFSELLKKYGRMPLPPYIKRTDGADNRDNLDYQTIFARETGAVAAPTAGLHFTPDLKKNLVECGIEIMSVTLHVGAGTFLPVKVDDTEQHLMHPERGNLSDDVAGKINDARKAGRRIVALGSTSLRLLESAGQPDGQVRSFSGLTDIFITPGYHFRIVDAMITNFHLPRSTLFMLVAAFAGLERMSDAYRYAIENGYRFYSYGDASLLERKSLLPPFSKGVRVDFSPPT